MPVGNQSWWAPVLLFTPSFALVYPVFIITDGFARELPLALRITIDVAALAVAVVLALAGSRFFYRRPFVNPTEGTIRTGQRQAKFAQLSSAKLITGSSKSRLPFVLVVKSDTGLRAAIPIRDAKGRALDPGIAAHVQDMIRQSSITMPVSPDDPTGRFARFNFPENVSQEDALELVTHPPESQSDLPTTSWHDTGRGR